MKNIGCPHIDVRNEILSWIWPTILLSLALVSLKRSPIWWVNFERVRTWNSLIFMHSFNVGNSPRFIYLRCKTFSEYFSHLYTIQDRYLHDRKRLLFRNINFLFQLIVIITKLFRCKCSAAKYAGICGLLCRGEHIRHVALKWKI